MNELDGVWRGWYQATGALRAIEPDAPEPHLFPIKARLTERLGQVEGTMSDLMRPVPVPYRTYYALFAMSERERARMRERMQHSHDARIHFQVPTESHLWGVRRGDEVILRKTYRGPLVYQWRFSEDDEHKTVIEHYVLEYRGFLSEDGDFLEGRWEIRYEDIFDRRLPPAAEGEFQLHRVPAALVMPGERGKILSPVPDWTAGDRPVIFSP
ncbi:hypothetical protein EON81_26320 [bacterium]|nr:MAG: hypothetical protein EON81_26320 [bacterium]